MTSLRRVFFASVSATTLAVGFGSHASAQTIYGGGASLPSVVLRQLFNCYGKDIRTAADPFLPAECTSPVNSSRLFTYATTGSGAGLRSFALRDPAQLAPVSGSNSVPYADNGTPAPSPLVGITYPFPAHHFSSSESPLVPVGYVHPTLPGVTITNSANQTLDCFYGNSVTTGGACTVDQRIATGGPLAVPALVTTGNIVANFGGVAKNIKLSRTSLCGIFTGGITNWNDAQITADNGGVSVSGGVSRTIQPVVRSDGSGTTFLVAQALEAMCTPARTSSSNYPSGFDYTAGVNTLPAWNTSFWRAPGNNGVAATVADTPWSVGYLSPDFTQPQVTTIQVFAPFNVTDGSGAVIKTLGTGASSTSPVNFAAYKTAILQNAKNNYKYATPTNANLAAQDGTPPGNVSQALDPVKWIDGALIADPQNTNAYPISGFNWWMNYTCYSSGSVANALRAYWTWYLDPTSNAGAILNVNGFGVMPTKFVDRVRSTVISNAQSRISPVVNPLNPNCTGKAGA